ncbi:Rho guanyl nucleotide exchange factor, putative [Talaromyces stipitatus ATCC 10500]|uniref:Rho guanyl nucleotide exchange factor, putative n=1 Tax=Talaromyces stipitatus (strain ATCC 10500 / CBS 375.48 / QM 6759 / NRRL 1006) TaxID=441959 RepID=B8LY19_TALSN|nr:Rho guanyl nucleotide exchange factor, putative [Talaromyces stipitatus ATCC 10500]EED23264.1 Rho guanyl nucleotide exchange factor, putative [Talaromyces stipitatus ATCC 10500]
MATISPSLADLPLEQLSLYHVVDPYLSSVLIFYGSVATTNSSTSSTRNQAHIFSAAGLRSYPRIIASPVAPLYSAVHQLPREKQGDEIYRGVAVSLLRYFNDIPQPAQQCLKQIAKTSKSTGRLPRLFEEVHAADLTNRMVRINNTAEIVRDLRFAYDERKAPWIDIDIMLPSGSIVPPTIHEQDQNETGADEVLDDNASNGQYGKFTSLIEAFGDPVFLPTSRLRRAPSQPTNLSKSTLFTRGQKEALRLAMCEVVDTEERYVSKVYDLVHNVVQEFQQKARSKSTSSSSPDETALAELFPPCLEEILQINMGFLSVIREILESTEQDALTSLAEDTDLRTSASGRLISEQDRDIMGSMSFANALIEWFPRFSEPYAAYMRAHNGFTQTLNSFLKDDQSSFSRRVYETGEQKLRSLLMEPVQRLPRYSLLIDTMTSNIPATHPSVRLFLKARDIIKEICSLDTPANTDHSQNIKRVMSLVEYWPPSIIPQGRLINAIDTTEVLPPYNIQERQETQNTTTLVLVYKNYSILLSRYPGSNMTARALLSDLEKQPTTNSEKPLSQPGPQFRFLRAFDLNSLLCAQSSGGQILYLMPTSTLPFSSSQSPQMTPHALQLSGMYEGRASRLIEEILKAKIEGRFSEREREGTKWTLRSPNVPAGTLGILAPVFEEDTDGSMQRSGCSRIRIVFDTPKAICTKTLDNASVDVIVSVSSADSDMYRMEVSSINGTPNTVVDTVSAGAFIATLTSRLCALLPAVYNIQNRTLTESSVYSNLDILRQIGNHIISQTKVGRGFRPPSPTKLISNLWGSSSQAKDTPSLSKAFTQTLVLSDIPKMSPKTVGRPVTSPGLLDEAPPKISVVGPPSFAQDDQLAKLEQTLNAYVLALRLRSGNIVGRSLRTRANADKAMVNELYNVLLEDPAKLQAAAEVPVDVLFVAFETFIHHAWKDLIGAMIAPEVLSAVQNKYDSSFPRDFEDYFRTILGDFSPQNRRALTATIRLLAELLDASGNDGDRGALTVAFAEVLTENEDPMQYISLLDRLVEDFENLFEESLGHSTSHERTPSRPRSYTGSVGSNASSFRKRLGFGHRENSSRSEGESKVSSLIRTWSKTKNSGESDGRLQLFRSKSTDTDSRLAELLRPATRERPTVYGAFLSDDNIRRPGSAHGDDSVLGAIHETPITPQRDPARRKKRRSSLSDLPPLSTPPPPGALSPIELPKPVTPVAKPRPQSEVMSRIAQLQDPESPKQNSLTRIPQVSRPPIRATSPKRPESPVRSLLSPVVLRSPMQKENIPQRPKLTERPVNKKSDGPASPTYTRKKRSDTLTSIPQPSRYSLQFKDRPVTSHGLDLPGRRERALSSPQKPQRVRMQSPQKLRDRLQSTVQAQNNAESVLRSELQLVGQELASLTQTSSPTETGQSSVVEALLSRIRNLEQQVSTFNADVNTRTANLEKDVETGLLVSEKRAKKLDELYRELSAENEALYERFNTELGKVVKEVRAGNGEDVLKTQLKTALEELSRVKKENLRLKREVGGLKAVRADIDLPSSAKEVVEIPDA